jgi:hypothetical protein
MEDGRNKLYLLDDIELFCIRDYNSYVLPKLDKRCVVEIIDDVNEARDFTNNTGYIVIKNDKRGKCDKAMVCYNFVMIFPKKFLIKITDPKKTGIIKYCKKFSPTIREKMNTFPTPDEIDLALKRYNSAWVYKTLYVKFLKKYFLM